MAAISAVPPQYYAVQWRGARHARRHHQKIIYNAQHNTTPPLSHETWILKAHKLQARIVSEEGFVQQRARDITNRFRMRGSY